MICLLCLSACSDRKGPKILVGRSKGFVISVQLDEMAAVSLSKIPTLRELYKTSVLRAIDLPKARYQPKDTYLDRVSL